MVSPSIQGLFYDGQSSKALPAELHLRLVDHNLWLNITAPDIAIDSEIDLANLPSRVGNIRRLIHIAGCGSVEVIDNDAFDATLDALSLHVPGRPARQLENSMRAALMLLAVVLVGTWVFLVYGVPTLADRAVMMIPATIDARIGGDTLLQLDRIMLNPSSLSAARQTALRARFATIVDSVPAPHTPMRLEFRRGGALKANAFALPSGVVVLTDELEALAQHDDELSAVFAHEIGHVVHRHSMRMLIQHSASALLMLGLLGDVNSATSVVAAVPGAMVNAAYSRDFERDADAFSFAWMSSHGIAKKRLGDLLTRVVAADGSDDGGFLASHPGLQERVNVANP